MGGSRQKTTTEQVEYQFFCGPDEMPISVECFVRQFDEWFAVSIKGKAGEG